MSKSKLLGLFDVLESTIVDGKRVPLTQNIMINENQVLDILHKMRCALNEIKEQVTEPQQTSDQLSAAELLSKANKDANSIL